MWFHEGAVGGRRGRGRRHRREVRRPPAEERPRRARSARRCRPARAGDHRRRSTSSDRLAIEQALPGLAREVGRRRPTRTALRDAEGLARARRWASSRPTAPCCRSPTGPSAAPVGRTLERLGRRLVDDPGAEGARGRAQRARRPHRRRRLRRARHLRRPGQHAEPDTRVQQMGVDVQPLPRDRRLLADARRAAHRAQPAPGRLRLDRRVPRPVPGLHRGQAQELRRAAPHPQRERLRHRRLRQVAPDARQRAGRRRARSTTGRRRGASTTGGASCRGAAGQYDPIITHGRLDRSACPRARTASSTTSPTTSPTRPSSGCTPSARRTPQKPWFMYYSTGCAHAPHHVAKEWADKYKGQFDDGWDALRERTLARQKELGIVPPDTELTERPDLFPAWDSPRRRPRRSSTRARWRSTAASRRTPTGTSAACSTRSRRWATSTTRWSSTSGATTARAWRARRPARSTS